MRKVDATWMHALKIYWSFTWRALLLVLFAVIWAIYLKSIFEWSDATVLLVVNLIVVPAATIAAIKKVIGIKYSDVQLVLVEHSGEEI
jgi:hypothetical protein